MLGTKRTKTHLLVGKACWWEIDEWEFHVAYEIYLEPQTTSLKWIMDGNGETTISYIKIWNHPIETAICKWLLEVPGMYVLFSCWRSSSNIDFPFLISIDFCDEAKVEYPFLQKPVISEAR